jgi:uncharacterized membrane protein
VTRVLRGGGSGRVVGVDVARGLALLGMAATHIFPSYTPDGDVHPAYLIAAGRASALFAVLAGVSLSLVVARRPLVRQVQVATAVRAVLLLVLGLALSTVDSPPLVILEYYALLFVVAVPLLTWRTRSLALAAAVWAVLSPLASHLLRSTVVPPFAVGEPDLADLTDLPGLSVQLAVSGIYPVLTWTTYLLVGLVVGRLALTSVKVAAGLLVGGAVSAVGAHVLAAGLLARAGGRAELARGTPMPAADVDRSLDVGLFGVTPTADPHWLVVAAPHSGTTLDLVATAGGALAVLGLCLLLTRRGAGPLLPVAAAGSMTLTLYTLHVLALRPNGPLLLDDRLDLWLLHVAAALVLATVWRLAVGRGPLEAVTTRVSSQVARATVRA